jgi:hypothetical protein
MAFQSREEYEAWKRRATAPTSASAPAAPSGATTPPAPSTTIPSPEDIELRLSPLYGALMVFIGLVFTVIGFVPFGKAGPTFHTICRIVGPAAILAGIVMLHRRNVIVRITSSALCLRNAVIPWNEIASFQRFRLARSYWIGINLKIKRTDLGESAKKAEAILRAMGKSSPDVDYVIMETDLPRSGRWFINECERRMAAAATVGTR